MVSTGSINIFIIFNILGYILLTEGRSVKREAEFEEPLYYHQMTHHKTSKSPPILTIPSKPTNPVTQGISSPPQPPTPTQSPGFSVLGELLSFMRLFASEVGRRSGFTAWWWGDQ